MKNITFSAMLLLYSLLIVTGAQAQIPQTIHYQGRLLNGTNPVNETVGMVIRLFNQLEGGAPLYADSNQVTIVDGLYSTVIGDHTLYGSLADVLTNSAVYIELNVNDVILAPREALSAAAYAMVADGVTTGAITTAMLAENAVGESKMNMVNTPVDGDVLAWNAGAGAMAWVTAGSTGAEVPNLITSLTVAEGETVSAGEVVSLVNGGIFSGRPGQTTTVFTANDTDELTATALSDSTLVAVYQDTDNSDYGTAVIGTVTNNTVEWGTPEVFSASQALYISVDALTSTNFVITWSDYGDSEKGKAILGHNSGNTILGWSAASTFSETGAYYTAVSTLSPNRFIVCYKREGDDFGCARAASRSGNTIDSWGAEFAFNDKNTSHIACTRLGSAAAMTVYWQYATVNATYSETLLIDPLLDISSYPALMVCTGQVSQTGVILLDNGNAVIAGVNKEDEGVGFAGEAYGTFQFDWSDPVRFYRDVSYPNVAALSGSRIVTAFRDNDFYDAYLCYGDVSQATLNWSTPISVTTNNSMDVTPVCLENGQTAVCYWDYSQRNGAATLLSHSIPIGIAAETKPAGQSCKVVLSGVAVNGISGLTPSTRYYASPFGPLTTDNNGWYVGVALDTDQFLIRTDWAWDW